ncbi:MAG: 3'-5' exoribonuclease [Prevotella sp.]|nr:3'-5' exoribonuclease [Prevotella sp.]
MLDITIDFETCSLCPTAAVMSIGAVAWKRYDETSPFYLLKYGTQDPTSVFSCHIDLRSMFINGFTFDEKTAAWWKAKTDEAKDSLLSNDSYELPCRPIDVAVKDLFEWAQDFKKEQGEQDICLWAQGSDFDIAILRHICYKFGIDSPVHHADFRDHRTFIYEAARLICKARGELYNPSKTYDIVVDYKNVDEGAEHDPVFDCKRSIYSTWQMMRKLAHLEYPE